MSENTKAPQKCPSFVAFIDMELQREPRYPLHGRAQVALPNQVILAGRTVDISVGGVCLLIDDQIPQGLICAVRFEMLVKGITHVITAQAKTIYGVFANAGGFRVGFAFNAVDAQRTALINSLAGKKPMVTPSAKAPEGNANMTYPLA